MVVADDCVWLTATFDDRSHFAHHALARDRSIRDGGQAFFRHVVDNVQHPEPSAVGEPVVDEIQRPAAVRTRRRRDRWLPSSRHRSERRWRRHRNPSAGLSSPNHEPFLAIEPPGLLAVHGMTLLAQKDMQATISEPSPLIGRLPQPRPQVRVIRPAAATTDRAPIYGDHGARPPFAHFEARPRMCDRVPLGAFAIVARTNGATGLIVTTFLTAEPSARHCRASHPHKAASALRSRLPEPSGGARRSPSCLNQWRTRLAVHAAILRLPGVKRRPLSADCFAIACRATDDIPCLRQGSATVAPASFSRKIPMICSSPNLLRFISSPFAPVWIPAACGGKTRGHVTVPLLRPLDHPAGRLGLVRLARRRGLDVENHPRRGVDHRLSRP